MEELKAVSDLLTDGKFVAYLVDQRQKALLRVASTILIEVTGGRLGFAEGFRVIDRTANLARGPKTLSGGEGFLASLALALALVEIAGRSGGTLDALFLDEGFGSLDATSLGLAMDALEQRAVNGRLVLLISHVRAVAEHVDTVLRVTRTPSGSQAQYLEGTERLDFLESELEAGLLS